MALPWIPRFVLGDMMLQLTYPVVPWNPGARTEGRTLFSATATQGVTLRLRKYILNFNLRMLESEIDNVIAFLSAAQLGSSFLWYPNAGDVEVIEPLTVFLELPRVATIIQPTRDTVYLSMHTLPIALSRLDIPWPLEYFRIPI
jgi:hypothetical protein